MFFFSYNIKVEENERILEREGEIERSVLLLMSL